MIPFLDLKAQYETLRPQITKAIDDVFEASNFILGAQVAAFEDEFARYLGTRHAVGVATGTDAIELALRATGAGPGDEVITAANTCVPTVAGIMASGATPVLADVDPATLTLDPASVASVLGPKTRAIVPVHLYGHPADIPALREAAGPDVRIIEDCAQAHGAMRGGVKCGTLADAAAFSFYPTKNLGAYGDCGAVTTNSADVADKLKLLRTYGYDSDGKSVLIGTNSRLDEMHAAILRVKLRQLDAWVEKRRALATAYAQKLSELPLKLPTEDEGAYHSYHLYVVRTSDRNALREHLRLNGVTTLVHYPRPIHLHPAYAALRTPGGGLPVAEEACNQVLSLPLYPEIPHCHLEHVCAAIQRFFR